MIPINQSDRTIIVQKEQDLGERLTLIEAIAELTSMQLQNFHSTHFSELSPSAQEGLRKLETAIWACTKTLKQIWPRLKEYMK